MRVFLDEALFSDPDTDHAGLVAIIRLARDQRHMILLQPAFRAEDDRNLPRQSWLEEHGSMLRTQLGKYLALSQTAATTTNDRAPAIAVIAGTLSRWPIAELCVEDACRFLTLPVRVLLEHVGNDLSFLLALCPAALRADLRRALDNGWAREESGNGINGLKQIVERWLQLSQDPAANQESRLRAWLMFDRDASPTNPNVASSDSAELARYCSHATLNQPWPLRFGQLPRRSIESYVPTETLVARDGVTPSGSSRHARLAALVELRTGHLDASICISLKEGLIKDSELSKADRGRFKARWERAGTDAERYELEAEVKDRLAATWQALPLALRANLLFGFGEDVASLFGRHTQPDWETWFDEEWGRGPATQPAREEIILGLLEMI